MSFPAAVVESSRTRWRPVGAGLAVAVALLLLSGCVAPPKPLDFDPLIPRLLMEAPPQAPEIATIELPVSHVQIPVYTRAVLSELDVANVELVHVDLGLCLMLECTPEGAGVLYRLSAANLGRRVVITLNGAPYGARLLEAPIPDGRFFIFVEMNDEQITAAAVDLKKTVHEVQAARARGEKRGLSK